MDTIAYTCMVCRVGFRTAENQRDHYKSDWHRYNLKRKMADMAPVSAADFRSRVLAQQEKVRLEEAQEASKVYSCDVCNKKFNSRGAFESHLASKLHRLNLAKPQKQARKTNLTANASVLTEAEVCVEATTARVGTESTHSVSEPAVIGHIDNKADPIIAVATATDKEDNTRGDGEEVLSAASDVVMTLEDNIFGVHRTASIEDNLLYMKKKYGFFIPDKEYVVDMPGLLAYLQEKVGKYHMCLMCNKGFHSCEAARNHMKTKGHCFVDYDEEGQLELEEFYDYSKSYPVGLLAEADAEDFDDGWEDITDDECDADDREGAVVIVLDEKQRAADRAMAIVEKARESSRISIDGMDLVLPGGARIGHREMRRYYVQRTNPVYEGGVYRDNGVMRRALGHYCATHIAQAWGSGSGAIGKAAKRNRDRQMYIQAKYHMNNKTGGARNGANKHCGSKFFREQNVQY